MIVLLQSDDILSMRNCQTHHKSQKGYDKLSGNLPQRYRSICSTPSTCLSAFHILPPPSQKLLPPPIPPPPLNLPAPYLKLPYPGGKECQKREKEVRKKPMLRPRLYHPPPAQFKIVLGKRPNSAKYFSKSPLVGLHFFFLQNPLRT